MPRPPEPVPGPDDETVRYGDTGRPPTPPAGVGPVDDDAMSATFLDPAVWSTGGDTGTGTAAAGPPTWSAPAPAAPADRPWDAPPQPPADRPWDRPPDGAPPALPPLPSRGAAGREPVHRYGPGVPRRAALVWGGPAATRSAGRRRRRALGWLVPAAVVLAVLAFLTRCQGGPPLEVTGVTVTADPATGPSCGGTAVVKAEVATNGGAGSVRYRWVRNDGTTSGELAQPARAGERRTELVLRWTFDGPGTMQATATVEVLAPQSHSAAVSFTYACRR